MSEVKATISLEAEIAKAVQEFQLGRNRDENFRFLMEGFKVPVDRLLRKWVDHERDREDLNQEIFLRVYYGLGGFEGASSFKTWLFTIARNTALSWLQGRSRATRIEAPIPGSSDPEDSSQRPEEQMADPKPGPLDELIAVESSAELQAAIALLPDRMKHCLQLRRAGWSYQEIADELGLSIGTVKAHLFQAKAKLLRKLGRGALGTVGRE